MTDQRGRAPKRLEASPLELRLYIIAVLSGVYLTAWWAVAGVGSIAVPAPAVPAAAAAAEVVPRSSSTVPAGWHVATEADLAGRATIPAAGPPRSIVPTVVRGPVSRPVRVRTRSS